MMIDLLTDTTEAGGIDVTATYVQIRKVSLRDLQTANCSRCT